MTPSEIKRKNVRSSIRKVQRQNSPGPPPANPPHQPMIVRTSENRMTGIHSFTATRYVLGYVVSGFKFIYTGDLRSEVVPGDIFFLAKGTHYVEETPDGRKPFEQVMFFYTSEQIGHIIAELGVRYNVETRVNHTCEDCMLREYVVSHGWDWLRTFFGAVSQNLRDGFFTGDYTAEMLALTPLVYQIISRPEGCLRTRMLGSTDPEKELMERQLRDYVFSDITLPELAARTNRSLSSLKKKFKDYYNEPPHRWVVRQRLMHARLQLISTNRDVSQIARESHFPNASYFIRLFRKEFSVTPTQYRAKFGNTVVGRKKIGLCENCEA